MTESQLEAAAREYCRLAEIDPEQLVSHGADVPRDGWFVPAILLYSPRWKRVARVLREQEIMSLAIEVGRTNERSVDGQVDCC